MDDQDVRLEVPGLDGDQRRLLLHALSGITHVRFRDGLYRLVAVSKTADAVTMVLRPVSS